MYIVALFTIAKIWKQPKCPSVNEWIKKILYMYAMEYCSLHKERKLPFVTTWVDLEDVMLSEIIQKKKYCMVSLICEI